MMINRIIILFIILSSAFGNVTSQVKLVAPLTTNHPEDTYPTHFDSLGKGGYMTVATKLNRDNIPFQRKRVGMFVYVVETDSIYSFYDNTWQGISKGIADESTFTNGLNTVNSSPRDHFLQYGTANYQTSDLYAWMAKAYFGGPIPVTKINTVTFSNIETIVGLTFTSTVNLVFDRNKQGIKYWQAIAPRLANSTNSTTDFRSGILDWQINMPLGGTVTPVQTVKYSGGSGGGYSHTLMSVITPTSNSSFTAFKNDSVKLYLYTTLSNGERITDVLTVYFQNAIFYGFATLPDDVTPGTHAGLFSGTASQVDIRDDQYAFIDDQKFNAGIDPIILDVFSGTPTGGERFYIAIPSQYEAQASVLLNNSECDMHVWPNVPMVRYIGGAASATTDLYHIYVSKVKTASGFPVQVLKK